MDERRCRVCGCTEARACLRERIYGAPIDPCSWDPDDPTICSACADYDRRESGLDGMGRQRIDLVRRIAGSSDAPAALLALDGILAEHEALVMAAVFHWMRQSVGLAGGAGNGPAAILEGDEPVLLLALPDPDVQQAACFLAVLAHARGQQDISDMILEAVRPYQTEGAPPPAPPAPGATIWIPGRE